MDQRGMELIEKNKAEGFAQYLKDTKNTICGRKAIQILLNIIDEVGKGSEEDSKMKLQTKFVKYAQSEKVFTKK